MTVTSTEMTMTSTMTETKSSRYIYIVANLKGGPKDKCNRISNNMHATIHNYNIEFCSCNITTYSNHYAVNSTPYIGFPMYVFTSDFLPGYIYIYIYV